MDKERKESIPAAAPADGQILNLTKEQQWAARLWKRGDIEEISAALGVPPEVIEGWFDQPLFLAEIAATRLELNPTNEQKQAAALVFSNCPYADTETAIGLKEGTIIEWVEDENSAFNALMNEMTHLTCPSAYLESDPAGLSEDQILAIPLIIDGKTDADVGAAIGKTRETVNRWRNHDPEFMRKLEAARKTCYDSQVAAVTAGTQKAIAVLVKLLDSDDEKVGLQAASLLLKFAPSLKEINQNSSTQDLKLFKEFTQVFKVLELAPNLDSIK